MKKLKRIFVHCALKEKQESFLKKYFIIHKHNANKKVLSPEELIKVASEFEGIICQGNTVDKKYIYENKKYLKAISNVAVGYDNIDLDEANKYKIAVLNTPNLLDNAVADLTFGLLIAVSRKICSGNNYVKAGKWKKNSWPLFWGDDLNGENLGIIGMGNIGKKVAIRANAFGLNIIYHNRRRLDKNIEKMYSANYSNLKNLLNISKYVVILTPLNKTTNHLINKRTFAMMRKDSYIINMARGKVIKEADLVEALENNIISGAGLDVFEFEPKVNKKLTTMDNVVLMPHAGSATYKTRLGMMDLACKNIVNYLIYNKCDNIVNRDVL